MGYPPGLGPDGALSTHTPNSYVQTLQTSSDILSFRKPFPFTQYHTDLLKKKKNSNTYLKIAAKMKGPGVYQAFVFYVYYFICLVIHPLHPRSYTASMLTPTNEAGDKPHSHLIRGSFYKE